MLRKEIISKAELSKILSYFDLGKINKLSSLATSGNIAYRIRSSKGDYFLRLSPSGPRSRSKNELLAEIELLDYLGKKKFPIDLPLESKDGVRLITWQDHFGYLRKFSEGRERLNPTLREVETFGEVLGQFHKLIKGYKTKNRRDHTWEPAGFKKYFNIKKSLILESNFKERETFVKIFSQELSKLKFPSTLPSGMIHEDLGKRHVLWSGKKIVALIDFDRTYYGKIILDLGQAIRGWCFVKNSKAWSRENFEALLKGYKKNYKLSPLEEKYLIPAIKFAILERAFAFCLRSITVTHDEKEASYARHSIFNLLKILETNIAPSSIKENRAINNHSPQS